MPRARFVQNHGPSIIIQAEKEDRHCAETHGVPELQEETEKGASSAIRLAKPFPILEYMIEAHNI